MDLAACLVLLERVVLVLQERLLSSELVITTRIFPGQYSEKKEEKKRNYEVK